MPIYVLRNPSLPGGPVVIGTAPWIADTRRRLYRDGLRSEDRMIVDRGLPQRLRNLVVLAVLDGDDLEAERLRAAHRWMTQPDAPWSYLPPATEAALIASGRPWDGADADVLGVKGLGPAARRDRPAKVSNGLGARLPRHRAKGGRMAIG